MTGRFDRRSFLYGSALAALPLFAGNRRAFAFYAEPAGLIERGKDPDNLEFPFARLEGLHTPNELFYVRNHFAAPNIQAKTWKLTVTGAVENPLELTYEQLTKMPPKKATMTLECAGNGRSFLKAPKGVPWGLGAVSTAEWAGVTLAAVLEKAGVKKGAADVVLEGADGGKASNDPKPDGEIHFARSLPLAKALKPEVLLAYKMNGADLSQAHGFPLRAVVGGWYGMASVKWLQRIVVTERPYNGYHQSSDYTYWDRRDGLVTLVPITEMEVKSSIARPAAGEVVAAGKEQRVHGAAWAGESEVAKVEVSTDGGKTWAEAKLLGDSLAMTWRLWEYKWTPPKAAKYTLMTRATDKRGRTQPEKRDEDRRSYMISHVLPVEVEAK
jgi:DMSO/TMAO reductase YedYZ molybdopterin-dependent catalytic subunit